MVQFRADVEGLRAVAVLLVVLDHLETPGFRGGFFGVDVFFVISGYLITSLLAAEYAKKAAHGGRGSISIAGFYARRARRILPAALTVIAAVIIAGGVLLNELRVAQIRHDAVWAIFFGSNVNFIRQATDYFAQGFVASSPFQHYWTLAVEEQFYLVWPPLFLLAARLTFLGTAVRWRARVATAAASIGVASLAWSIVATARGPAGRLLLDFHARMGARAGRPHRDRDNERDAALAPDGPGDVRGRRCVVRGRLRSHQRHDAVPGCSRASPDSSHRAAHRRRPHRPGATTEPGALTRTPALPRPHLVLRLPVALAAHRVRSRAVSHAERDRSGAPTHPARYARRSHAQLLPGRGARSANWRDTPGATACRSLARWRGGNLAKATVGACVLVAAFVGALSAIDREGAKIVPVSAAAILDPSTDSSPVVITVARTGPQDTNYVRAVHTWQRVIRAGLSLRELPDSLQAPLAAPRSGLPAPVHPRPPRRIGRRVCRGQFDRRPTWQC